MILYRVQAKIDWLFGFQLFGHQRTSQCVGNSSDYQISACYPRPVRSEFNPASPS